MILPQKMTPEERLVNLYTFCKFDNKPLLLDDWQNEFLLSTKQFISILKSRRTGFSFATALKGLSKALDFGRTKYTKQFVSYNESDALEKIRYATEFYDSMPAKNKKKLVVKNKSELEFLDANGKTTSRLISMPCKAPRGKGGDISIDEMGVFLPKMSKLVYTGALYVISRGGCIEVGSTPLGCIGMFYEICTDREKYPAYQRFNVPWWFSKALCTNVEEARIEAPNMNTAERVERYATETLRNIFANAILEDFQQECECSFIDTAESYITLEEIYKNTPSIADFEETIDFSKEFESEEVLQYFGKELQIYHSIDDMCLSKYDKDKDGLLYIGYDVAKKRDATSIFVLGRLPSGIKKVYGYEELRAADFETQLNCIRKLMQSLPIERICLDSTGMGSPLCERLERLYPQKVEGITFTLQSKETLAQNIKIGLQKKEFLLPNDKNLHHQIHSIKRTASTGGHFRYDADRDENGHADSFWAFALANLAATESKNFYARFHDKKIEETENETEIQKVIRKAKTLTQLNNNREKLYKKSESW